MFHAARERTAEKCSWIYCRPVQRRLFPCGMYCNVCLFRAVFHLLAIHNHPTSTCCSSPHLYATTVDDARYRYERTRPTLSTTMKFGDNVQWTIRAYNGLLEGRLNTYKDCKDNQLTGIWKISSFTDKFQFSFLRPLAFAEASMYECHVCTVREFSMFTTLVRLIPSNVSSQSKVCKFGNTGAMRSNSDA